MYISINEILGSYEYFLNVEIHLQGRFRGKQTITGIPRPKGLGNWFTLQDLGYPQQIYVTGLQIPPELGKNTILDVTGMLKRREDGLFYIKASYSI